MDKKNNVGSVINFHDRPIRSINEDAFHFKERIVDKIYSFLNGTPVLPITIAITGEWGMGKSSVIHLLKSELEKNTNNIIIYFEPLLEGKLDIPDIIELFYLQLYKKITDSKIKSILKSSLKSLALLARFKVSGDINLLYTGKVSVEKDFGKDIDDLLKLWNKQQPRLFQEQAEELNQALKSKDYKLFIIIDEIDRLTSDKVMNFLLFARVLELFDNLVCIVGLDYSQTLKKIRKEGYLGLSSYDAAKDYLDKLFQCEFKVYISREEKVKFAFDRIKKIDEDRCLLNLIESEVYESTNEFSEVVNYLATPRQIKKWLVLVKIHFPIIKSCPHKMNLLQFLSAIVKHPILFENLSRYCIELLKQKGINLQLFLKEVWGIDSFKADQIFDANLIFLASLGIKNEDVEKNAVAKQVYDQDKIKFECDDIQLIKFSKEFLSKIPVYIIMLLVEGYIDNEKTSAYSNFFDGDINSSLETLIEEADAADILASDLANSLRNYNSKSKNKPSIDVLNKIWRDKCVHPLGNPYPRVVLYCLANYGTIEEIIQDADLSLSEDIVIQILREFGINNENGKYEIDKMLTSNIEVNIFTNLIGSDKRNINSLKTLLKCWVDHVYNTLSENKNEWYKQTLIMSVFYRFIQFGDACGLKNMRDKLVKIIVKFLEENNITSKDKENILQIISDERIKYKEPLFSDNINKSAMEFLFNNNKELISKIDDFERSNIR